MQDVIELNEIVLEELSEKQLDLVSGGYGIAIDPDGRTRS